MSDIETGSRNTFPFSWISENNYLKQLFEGTFDTTNYDGFIERDIYESVKEWIIGYIENTDFSNGILSEQELIGTLSELGLLFQAQEGNSSFDKNELIDLAGNKYSYIDPAQIISKGLKVLNSHFPNQQVQEYIYPDTIFIHANGMDRGNDYIRVSKEGLMMYQGFEKQLQNIARRKLRELKDSYTGEGNSVNARVIKSLDDSE